jgi:hypothetical protein
MPNKLTTAEWTNKANATHGKRYDYSEVDYVRAKEKVIIRCLVPGHGKWLASPSGHLSGKGCPLCGGSTKKTTGQFVEDARIIHGDKYNYENCSYINSHTNVSIKCSYHGAFEQSPTAHISGRGCPTCGQEIITNKQRMSTKGVLELLNKPNSLGGNVTFNEGTYRSMNERMAIKCSIHGKQLPRIVNSMLTSKHPCLKCSEPLRSRFEGITESKFRAKLDDKFNGQYGIELFNYIGGETRVNLYCAIDVHGGFSIQASHLHKSRGCPKCRVEQGYLNRTLGLQKSNNDSLARRKNVWMKKVLKVHGKKYDYSKVVYTKQQGSVTIGCPSHGWFEQVAYTHTVAGCSQCANEGLKGLYSEKYFHDNPEEKGKPGKLYYIYFESDSDSFYKVGITQTSIAVRFAMVPKEKVAIEILGLLSVSIYEAWLAEDRIQKNHGSKYRHVPNIEGFSNREMRIGPTECFSQPLSEDLLALFPQHDT